MAAAAAAIQMVGGKCEPAVKSVAASKGGAGATKQVGPLPRRSCTGAVKFSEVGRVCVERGNPERLPSLCRPLRLLHLLLLTAVT